MSDNQTIEQVSQSKDKNLVSVASISTGVTSDSPALFGEATMYRGYIKTWRRLTEWEWYKTPFMVHLFLHLICKANHKTGKWQGIEIQRGQCITGRKTLNVETGISERIIRTCLRRLRVSGEIVVKSTSKWSLITICNYERYQSNGDEIDQQATSKRPASDQQATTNKNDKNVKKEENTDIDFNSFWNAYPRKKARQDALKAWKTTTKIRPPIETILLAIATQLKSPDWTKDNGQFIPYPATWLRAGSWDDVIGHSTPISPTTDPLVLDYAKQACTQIKQGIKVAQFYHGIVDKIGRDKLSLVKREAERMLNNK